MVQSDPNGIRSATLPAGPQAAWTKEELRVLRWIFFVRGALGLVAGILLLVWPDRTLLLVGVILGVFLVAFGVLEMARAVTSPGRLAMERVIPATLGLLAVGAGTIAIARPESSVLAVALAVGIYLVVVGLATGVSAIRERDGRFIRAALALIDLAAGILSLLGLTSRSPWSGGLRHLVRRRGLAEIVLGTYVGRAR